MRPLEIPPHNYKEKQMSKRVVVVGAGFAGITAARDLNELGYRVTLLEARDRVGGTAYRRKFASSDVDVELGGAWFAGPRQPHVHREVVRHGLQYKSDPAVTTFAHLIGGKRIETPVPIEPEDYLAFERGAFHVLNAAQHLNPDLPIDAQPLKSFDVGWEEFLSQVELTPNIRDLFNSNAFDAIGTARDNGSALTLLWSTALFGNSIVNRSTLTDQQLEGGTTALIDAILGDAPEIDLRLNSPVATVGQDGTGVTVLTVDGTTFKADGVVVAVPVNVWDKIEFKPPLSPDKIAGGALKPRARGAKGWALVKNAPAEFYGTGSVTGSNGVSFIKGEGEIDGHQLLMIFSPVGATEDTPDGFNPLDKEVVQRAVEAFIPGAEVVEVDGHDWNADPYSDGAWSCYKVGQIGYLGGMRKPEGRLTFAGSDICRGWVSWIDGAIESGTSAAAELDRLISRD
ncbi:MULTISPECIES: NAD(P)/FAD-dependent oxidoreductase [unclassified Mycolicibacterium]|nr:MULTISPECIES: NAD(P)/FAD-dependent oxidoreductase [unclassified Mycolicibacterium]